MYEMSNREIRRRAWDLCRGNFWKIFGASCFISILVTVCFALGMLMGALGMLMAVAAMLILMPVLEVGMVQFTGNLWNDEFASISTLFTHTDKIGRIWGILFQLLLRVLLVMLPFSAVMFAFGLIGETAPATLIAANIAVALATLAVMFWIGIRLSLPLFALVMYPQLKASECIRVSWMATRGKVWRIFCHMLILALPMIAMEVLVQVFIYFNQTNGVAYFVLNLATMLLSSLFNGYITLGQYGLAQQLILNASPNS